MLKKLVSNLVILCGFAFLLSAIVSAQEIPSAQVFFGNEDAKIYGLAQKIERKKPIALDDVKALPEGALNKRYDDEMTLLFFALGKFNAQAIDILLEAGADPYMIDSPSTGSERDFTFYFSYYKADSRGRYSPRFVNAILQSYLDHGGDPNHKSVYPVLSNVAQSGNLAGIALLVAAGADLMAPLDNDGYSAANLLATDKRVAAQKMLEEYIDQGLLDKKPEKNINNLLFSLQPTGDNTYTLRDFAARRNAEKLLYRYPDLDEDSFAYLVFGGPIPWDDIKAQNFTDPVTGKRDDRF